MAEGYLVGKHGAGNDVANREDVARSCCRPEVFVHLDAPALIQLHAHIVQAQALP